MSIRQRHREIIESLPAAAVTTKSRIRGQEWLIVVAPISIPELKRNYGYCVFDDQTIYIRWNLDRSHFEETLIHEILHAAHPDMHEDAVTDTGRDAQRAIRKVMGLMEHFNTEE